MNAENPTPSCPEACLEAFAESERYGPQLESYVRIHNPEEIKPGSRQRVFDLAYRFSQQRDHCNCSGSGEPFVDDVREDSMLVHAAEHLANGILEMDGYKYVGGYVLTAELPGKYQLDEDECLLTIIWGRENHRDTSYDDAKKALHRAISVVNRYL
jgi:hypothetical protein